MSDNGASKSSPPYLAYSTFEGLVDNFSKTAVPPRVDRSVLGKMAGSTQNQVLASLRFLGLVDTDNTVTESLEQLVIAKKEGRFAEVLGPILQQSYSQIVDGLNLENATEGQLKEAFAQKGGLSGDALEKSIRFFLKGMKVAGEKLSPHFPAPRKTANRASRKPASPSRQKTQENEDKPRGANPPPSTQNLGEGLIEIPLYLPGKPVGALRIPENLDLHDCEMITSFIQSYAKRRGTAQ